MSTDLITISNYRSNLCITGDDFYLYIPTTRDDYPTRSLVPYIYDLADRIQALDSRINRREQ
jgi:hypothetical protein